MVSHAMETHMRLVLSVLMLSALTGTAALTPAALAQSDTGFFAAIRGDPVKLKAALADASARMARNPNDANALVEHGMLTFIEIGTSGARADAAMFERMTQATAQMNRAVELAPHDPRVRVLRGITLHQGSRPMTGQMSRSMLEDARLDMQKAYEVQAHELDSLGEHRLGELLQIKADVESRLGRTAEAERTYALIRAKLPDTEYAARAEEWMATRTPLPATKTTCIGCHVTP
jgi:hypothetical protein